MKKCLLFLLIAGSSHAQTLKEALRLNDNEQYDAANAIYKNLAAKDPGNGNIYYAYGENMLDAGQQDSALLHFNQGLKAEPGNAINLIGIAKVKLSTGLMAEAKPLIDQALQKSAGKNAIILLEAGEAYTQFKSKDLLSAQTYLESALKLDPKNPDIYNALGDVYSELNNGTSAVTNYNKALEIDKNYTKAILHRGQLYKRSTNYEGAEAEFLKALSIDANFAPAYRELGEVYYLQRKLDKAKESYKRYLDLSQNNNIARLRYTSFLFGSKSYPEALTELNQIVPVDSANIGLMRLSAYINHETGDSVKAKQFIDKLWMLTESDTAKRITLDYEYYGKILTKMGNDSLGGLYIWQAYQMEPSKTEILNDLASMYMKGRRYAEAAKVIEEKVRIGKNVTTTDYFNLGKAYYYSNQYAHADSAFAKVIEVQPDYAYGYWWRGRANLQMDSKEGPGMSKPYYEKFIEVANADTANSSKYKKTDLVEAYGNIGLAYFQEKNYEQASVYSKKVLDLDPDNQNAKTILGNIRIIREGKNKR